MNNKIAVITVTFNTSVIEDFISSLKKQRSKDFHLFAVDISENEKETPLGNIPHTVIKSPNKGYSYGVNRGVEKAIETGFTKFCIVNDDIYFESDFVDRCIASMSKYPEAIIGGKIYYAPGYEYHKSRYEKSNLGNVLWYAGGSIDWDHAFAKHRGVDEIDKGQYNKFDETDFVNGCMMLYNLQVHKNVGEWDESYFLYFEDTDYCERAKRKGVKLCFDPSIKIWHKVSQSTGGSGSSLHVKYQEINRVRFGLKYAPLRTKIHLVKNYLLSFLKFK